MKNGMIINEYGARVWWHHGKIHRSDGPAIEWKDGTRIWYCNGEHHRTDGPAMEWANGHREWWLNDTQYTFAEWLKHNPTLDSKTRTLYTLRYSGKVSI